MVKHIKVNSISTAWEVAASIFPTDYKKDEESSKRAGYPIYTTTSTDESFSGFHISDLNTRLEVSMGAETAMIWVEENEEETFEIAVKGLRNRNLQKARKQRENRSKMRVIRMQVTGS